MKLKLVSLAAMLLLASPSYLMAQEKGGVINVATIGEPPTLDPMTSTADLVGIVTQHIFETLYIRQEVGRDAASGRGAASDQR